ncbi:helix-turn-helix transcriptional regulator [Sorangium sp. So ce861]|uniref:helix-turn-helix transcriptional regulator n=1 Tax=Sorangium sp. So ce861 TaxID=3133323 RepID=UPI003F629727
MPGNGSLGAYLRELRTRLDPAALGYPSGRRRTPGLRREEVAQRARISATWYSWLEQGRGGAPSAQALDRLAKALMLTEVEREHLFLLGLGRPPEVRYQPSGGVTPRLQRVLDALDACPAMIRTATWDVVAWNRAAAAVLTDYGALPSAERNVLRQIFLDPRTRAADLDWESAARFVVGVFRGDAARAGAAATVQPLVDELCAKSPDFAAMWRDGEVHSACEGVKRLRHPVLGEIALEFSSFAVDGRPDLAMLVYTPLSADEAARIRALAAAHAAARAAAHAAAHAD